MYGFNHFYFFLSRTETLILIMWNWNVNFFCNWIYKGNKIIWTFQTKIYLNLHIYIWYLFSCGYIWLIQLKLFLKSISVDNSEATFPLRKPDQCLIPLSMRFKNLIYQIWQDHKTCKIKDTESDINSSRMDAWEVSNS